MFNHGLWFIHKLQNKIVYFLFLMPFLKTTAVYELECTVTIY